jgi:hypothetical protein
MNWKHRQKERSEIIRQMYLNGLTGVQIGKKFNISRERVRQILKKFNLKRNDGGQYKTRRINWEIEKNNKWLKNYKCKFVDFVKAQGCEIKSIGLARRYIAHRRNAKHRGIKFLITFPEWVDIWTKSGHLNDPYYCMARFLDRGPYSLDNVEIITNSQNLKNARKYKSWGVNKPTISLI